MKKDTFKALRDKVINIRESNYVDEIVSKIVERLMKQLPNIKNSNQIYSLECSLGEYDKKDIIDACKIIESKVPGIFLLSKDRDIAFFYIRNNIYYKFTPFTFFERWFGC